MRSGSFKPMVRRGIIMLLRWQLVHRPVRAATLRGWLPEAVWVRLPVPVPAFFVSIGAVRFRYLAVDGDAQLRPLYWRGAQGVEPETLAVFASTITRGRTFADVGANTGLFTLLACAANPHVTTHAFEAVPRVRAFLEANLAVNDIDGRCTVHGVAASSETGPIEFVVPDGPIPTSSHLSSAAYRSHEGERIVVDGVRLDDVLHEPVDVVKIDVEGAEDSVLEGMTRILTHDRPVLFVECLGEGPYENVQRILDEFAYSYFHLRSHGETFQHVAQIAPDPTRTDRNFMCIPSEVSLESVLANGRNLPVDGRSKD